jgi:hypothetical protein
VHCEERKEGKRTHGIEEEGRGERSDEKWVYFTLLDESVGSSICTCGCAAAAGRESLELLLSLLLSLSPFPPHCAA